MAYLDVEQGRTVYYESHGSGDSAVLLIHGWGMSARTWDYVLPRLLEASHRVVTFDHRGCGASDADMSDLGINAIADDVVNLVTALDLGSVVLNGWSLGGAVAVAAAARLGTRCRALVLTGAATPIYVQKPDLPLGGSEQDFAATLDALHGDRVNFLAGLSKVVCAMDVGEPIEQWLAQIFIQASPLTAATIAQLGPLDQRELLLALDIPILSLSGSADTFVDPAICQWVADHCQQATSIVYPGVGHAPFLEVTDQYNNDLLNFLDQI